MPSKPRLDRILVNLGLLTEEQVRQTLERQRSEGGKFGAHLLASGLVSERDLVRALAVQYDCPGVALENLNVPEAAIALIERRIAISRRLVPIEVDPECRTVRVAAANPHLPGLVDELVFLLKGWDVELAVASESSILEVISRSYSAVESDVTFESDDETADSFGSRTFDSFLVETQRPPLRSISSAVFVCRNRKAAQKALRGLIADGTDLRFVSSPDEALDELLKRYVDRIYIQEDFASASPQKREFESRVRALNFSVEVVWFGELSSLALRLSEPFDNDILRIIELLVSLLHVARGETDSRPFMIARYTGKICDHLGLRLRDRQKIIMAGLFHHLARFSGDYPEGSASRKLLMHRTAALLESIGLDEELVSVLREAYADSEESDFQRQFSLGALGGSIVTVVDVFCEDHSLQEPVTLMQFEELKRRLLEERATTAPIEVIEALIHTLQEECLNQRLYEPRGEVAFYHDARIEMDPFLLYQLTRAGIRVTAANSLSDLAQVCERRSPDVILLATEAKKSKLVDFIEKVQKRGVSFQNSPGILICSSTHGAPVDRLYEMGVHDLIATQAGNEILSAKTLTLIDRLRRSRRVRNEGERVAHGSLADISLIDLLQALGPGRKTIKISLNSEDLELNIYLAEGQITHAELGDMSGAAAIYRGLGWQIGTFTISKVEIDDIPAANVHEPNESIMMEGCRLLDEASRSPEAQDFEELDR